MTGKFSVHSLARMNHQRFPSILFLSVYFITCSFVFSQSSENGCILNIDFSLPWLNNSNCKSGDLGSFIKNTCCYEVLDAYLYALAQRANQTTRIFLDFREQQVCLASTKRIDNCGIEKLTSGTQGCSSYSTSDVINHFGDVLRGLVEDCKVLDSNGSCNACLTRWNKIGGLLDDDESNLCRFALLITLISSRFGDVKWVNQLYECINFPTAEVAKSTGYKKEMKGLTKSVILLIMICILGIGVLMVIATWIFIARSRNTQHLPSLKEASYDLFSGESKSLKLSVKEINAATNNLSASNYIGQGIAGKVYKGVLSNGQHVAIKHIINDVQVETFVREITSLSHVRHPNLVALLGYCEKEDECYLVYELCENGNLAEWLYGTDTDRILSWIQRLEIAIDSARGLWFLHSYPEGRVIHRDIKPTNILISADFQAKLSDFGLSKVMDVGQSYVSSEVRGTWGYVDPEYRMNRQVNALGDVYSFGVVLLQLISGKRVINLNASQPMPLSKMAKFLTRGGNIRDFADPKLNGEYSMEAFDLILKLALLCTGLKQDRPSMDRVVAKLENALNISTQEKPDMSF